MQEEIETFYTCPLCTAKFRNFNVLKLHMEEQHGIIIKNMNDFLELQKKTLEEPQPKHYCGEAYGNKICIGNLLAIKVGNKTFYGKVIDINPRAIALRQKDGTKAVIRIAKISAIIYYKEEPKEDDET